MSIINDNINNRLVSFFSGQTSDDAPECVLLNAVQALMSGITQPRILRRVGNLNGDFEQRLLYIEDYLKHNELYVTGFEPDDVTDMPSEGGVVNFMFQLHGSKLSQPNLDG